ncbi:MAG: TRAP transporter small permease [Alphaproteobacteria bacterium]|nr:TRAP transporter small permease [Alphaproteobacteria bacterium]MBU1281233.1 TRAP transporter small permease [Alphaproteobacteria bacterium]MBU1575572.1 TRAP transporter small permease [Alphaproteobacteria bacterium]MBU1829690.1 TRAP transporter small permease [Alphaproteobacteria bacterium]MBU2076667.1 TRAP transporter small permease [Alphaproteobacteria bacterium]
MTPLIDKFEILFEKFNIWIAICVAGSIGLFAALVPFDFFSRKLGGRGLEWLNEGAEYGLYAGVFLSSAWVLYKGAHVRVDIILTALPARIGAKVERAIDLSGALLCLLMAYFGAKGTFSSYIFWSLPDKDLQVPNWIVLGIFTVSFVMLAIEFLFRYRRAGRPDHEISTDIGF